MSYIPFSDISSISLYPLGNIDNEIDSHVRIESQESMRGSLPYPGGISDAHMGSISHEWKCETCKYDKRLCPGHYGSIKLRYPILSPVFLREIIKWLKIICFNCGKLIINFKKLPIKKDRILGEFVKLATRANKNVICVHCGAQHPYITKDKSDPISINMEFYEIQIINKPLLIASAPIYPHQIRAIFEKISDETLIEMGKPVVAHPRKFILSIIRVPPNPIRPDIKKNSGTKTNNNDLTVLLQTIVKINLEMPETIPNVIDNDLRIKIHNLCLAYFDLIKGSSGTSKRSIVNNSHRHLTSILQREVGKYGRIRRNLMGRRANHMARSFITCDTSLEIDTIGVPISIASNIQFPEVVREYNFEQMMVYFMNGRKRYPGCTKIVKNSNKKIYNVEKVEKLEIGDIVHRDIVDGDIVGFNRQPSLEVSSITSVKVKIMKKGDTIRLNILSCPFFNADFDGDAMNILFVKSNRVVNEIEQLSSPSQFFISYKNGKPKIGEAQDSIIGMAELTQSNTYLDKYHAMQLFMQIKVYHDFSQYPTNKRFQGRELVSILLKETKNLINYTGIAKMYHEQQAAYRKYDKNDVKVEIDRGEIKSGILDKASIGAEVQGGLFHIINNQYGSHAAIQACFNIQQMALSFLFNRGLTVSVKDILLSEESIREIYKIEEGLIAESLQITEQLNKGKIIPPIGRTINEYYEELQINSLKPGDAYWQYILKSIDTENNNLYKIIMVGARGDIFNFEKISSAIGQLEINGERMIQNFGDRTLPYFTKYDSNPSSRGYVGNSYISGLNLTELFFHAQEARYALINKGLSTSIAGMQNRMAIKNLESIIVDNQYKSTNDDKIIQFVYGGDGCDPRFIELVKFPIAKKELSDADFELEFHSKITMFEKEFQNKNVQKLLDDEFEQLIKDRDFYREIFMNLEYFGRVYKDTAVLPVNINRLIEDTLYNLELKKVKNEKSNLNPIKTIEKVKNLCNNLVYCLMNEIQEKKKTKVPIHLQNATSLLQILIRSYLNTSHLTKRNINNNALDIIINNIRNTYIKSLISYGKTIGIIASQSISEPMTQKIIDSHHFSGTSSTKKQGMVKIKEILGVRPTANMKSPTMILQVLPVFAKNKNKVQEIANHIEMLFLKRFVRGWQIFFEKFGAPEYPAYAHEKVMIAEFEKYNVHIKRPSDLSNWCIRFSIDKSKLIEKMVKVETIYHTLRSKFTFTYIVYSTDNDENIIFRIYIRDVISKKGVITTQQMIDLTNKILDTIIRGIDQIKACYVQTNMRTIKKEDGSLASETYYNIFTDGTNLKAILENPYIDPDTVQSDSILEMNDICGVATARQVIINELRTQIDGISYRHYTVYADTMTYNGITSIDRYGSARRNSSILLRISDASPVSVLEESAINNFGDDLKAVSAPIMIGKTPFIGDLYNSFKIDEEFIEKNIKNIETLISEL